MSAPTPEQMANWPAPNYINPETRVNVALGWIITTMTLMLLFIAARIYSRAVIKGSFGRDDWVMTVAAALSLSVSITACAATSFGLGYHLWDIRAGWIVKYAKIGFLAEVIVPWSMSLTKISICLTYLRLFPSRPNKIFCWSVIVYLICWTIMAVFTVIFLCIPVAAQWDVTIENKTCLNLHAILLATACSNSVSDVLVYLWPARTLWTIQLPLKERMGLVFIFAVGCIVCVAGICRIWYFHIFFSSYDTFWNSAILWSLTCTEVDIGIVCGCLPGTKPLLARIFPRLLGSSQHSNSTRIPHHPHSQSFPFQSLSGRDGKGSSIQADTDNRGADTNHYAWASGPVADSDGDSSGHIVPTNCIQVSEEVTVDSGAKTPDARSKGEDAGSEEWIIHPDSNNLPT
ncbi:hypothetical protein K432DRAFT_429625 [Lepidopterella palustris CBS 459.81]|uniref:Rhodopsin domain-containing protein n=1 Tax=Lepidopterella palustris CBS 459.81 TaxID=1314670 RepID=A0A8E2E0G4_9PEZI|nr:hypothetical protein K432DRAFT_429625 [Lepidopterella palustris CBS 459.81]